MDYEKKYNEALERAKKVKHDIENIGCSMAPDMLEVIFPELAESEDERIRRTLVEYFGPQVQLDFVRGVPIQKIRDWLEKQKDLAAIPDELVKNYKLFCENGRREVAVLINAINGINEQKEQKPASTEDMPYITDEHFFERELADSFRYKLAEYMTKNCRKEESPDGYTYHISAEFILKMAEEELIKRGELQKPVEWSEEDERMRNQLVYDVEQHKKEGLISAKQNKATKALYNGIEECYDEKIAWLKSLRPQPKRDCKDCAMFLNGKCTKFHWKPSEEQSMKED